MVGIEVRRAFVEKVKLIVEKEQIKNVHVLLANANTAVSEIFTPESLELVAIFFPDPWYKPRHLKRRVVQPAFLDILAKVMKKNAILHIASDKHELALDMRDVCNTHPAFENLFDKNDWANENFTGFETDIEGFHIKRKNPIYRLQYKKR
jgi:tRNA (guanine-N7-)-methyltransferase